MPWQNNGGGSGGGGRNPWGNGPQRGGPKPPDIDDIIRQGQEKLKGALPGGAGGSRGLFLIILLIALVGLGFSITYRVDTGQQGVVLRFGEYVRSELPGLHFKLPYPIETVVLPTVEAVNRVDIGFRQNAAGNRTPQSYDDESLMLSGDENIVDVDFTIFWRIKPEVDAAGKFLFNIQSPQEVTIKDVAESAMREVVGQGRLQYALTEGRGQIQTDVRTLMQSILDAYDSGIQITEVKLEKVDPPAAVIDAFRDVQAAKADQERVINEAQAYANNILPRAQGQAQQIIREAEGYKAEVVSRAQGEASRFIAVYNQYTQAKDITRKRIYLETMEDVLSDMDKIIVDQSAGQGVVPYLPLPEVDKRRNQGGN